MRCWAPHDLASPRPVARGLLMSERLQLLAAAGSVQYVQLAVLLSLLSGVMLLAFGLLRLGFLAHFLSHPVISGFITGSAVLIAVGQLKHLLGVKVQGENVFQTLSAWPRLAPNQARRAGAGGASVLFLWFARKYLASCWCAQVGPPKRLTWPPSWRRCWW